MRGPLLFFLHGLTRCSDPEPIYSMWEKNTSLIAVAEPPSSTDNEGDQMDRQIIWQANELRTLKVTPSLVTTEQTFAWTTGKIRVTEHVISTVVHPLPLNVCCASRKSWLIIDPSICSPQSTSPLHVPRASWGECRSAFERYWWTHMAMGKTLWHKHTHTCERMHTDAQSNTVPRKYVAVYMYSISTMYSLRCCNLHVDL